MLNFFSSDFAKLLKNKIAGEIGEKYTQSSSKFSTLLTAFVQVEIIEKGTDEEKLKEIDKNSQALAGTKEIVRVFDKKGEEW